jgi:yersiniabactin nonribosomal peptide synthetase
VTRPDRAADPALQDLLATLVERGIHLRAEAGQLRVRALPGQLTPELRERVAQHKAGLLGLLKERTALHGVLPPLKPRPDRDHEPFPLTDMQRAYWLGRQPHVELGGFSTSLYLELQHTGLDLNRMEDALQHVIARHGMLRAVLTADGQQRVLQQVPRCRIAVQDLRQLTSQEAEAALAASRAAVLQQLRPADRWPLFDIRAARLPGGAVRLCIHVDLLLMDAASILVCTRDWEHVYEHPHDPLPPLGLSYRDVVMYQQALESSAAYRRARDYWMARLDQLPGAPALPLAVQPAALADVVFVHRRHHVCARRWHALKARARQHGATPSSLLMTVFAEVLRAWSAEPDFTLNLTLFNRPPVHPDVGHLVGDFTTTLLLALQALPDHGFAERLQRLQRRLSEDLEHRACSGTRVQRELGLRQGRALGAMPVVFTSTLGLDGDNGFDALDWLGDHVYGVSRTPQVWLDHQMAEWHGELVLMWDAVDALFPAGLVDDMFTAYRQLLERLADDPGAWQQRGFDLLPPSQRRRREAANDTAAPLPEGLLHHALEQAALRSPDAVALVARQRTLSRGELDRLSNQLAHALRAADIGPGALAAVCIAKGWQQVVAAFGVLKAGAAYVPLDPAWPDARLAELLESTGAKAVLLAAGQHVPSLPGGVALLRVDDAALASWPGMPPPLSLAPQSLAYVIHTSGSSGRPKGVAVSHRAALNTIVDVNRRFGIGEGDVVFGLSALHFDLSVYDLFGTLAAGGTLVLPGADELTDPLAWAATVRRHSVTVWNSVPALMQLLTEAVAAEGGALPSLKTVMLSGDWIPLPLPAAVRAIAPEAHVISLGGATEAGIWSIWHPADAVQPHWSSIPYGRPLANQRWHILDAQGHDVPEWVPGPLYIAGVGLADGYWRDPERTAQSFVAHPRTGERLYRTGDLGRWLPDGSIEFLGRADLQLKIQGLRIEPGEIEQALLGHPHVAAAAVLTTGERGHRQIVGFMLPHPGQQVHGDDLRGFLASRLPVHLVPARLLVLERWPLTANGKLDRPALARLASAATTAAVQPSTADPATPEEKLIAEVWQEVLRLPVVGRDDDFFALGGESFTAIQAMTRLGQRLGRHLPVAALIDGRTVAGLAQRLALTRAPASPRVPLALPRQQAAPPLFLLHAAGGHVLAYRALAEAVARDSGRAVVGLQAPGLDDGQAPVADLQALVRRHLDALPPGPCVLGGWSAGGIVAFETARQRLRQGLPVDGLVLIDAPSPWPEAPPADQQRTLAAFVRDLDLGLDPERLTPAERAAHPTLHTLLPLLCQRQGLALPADLPQLDRILRVFDATLQAVRGCGRGAVATDLLVVKAGAPGIADMALHPQAGAADWGWSAWTSGRVDALTLPGGHHAVLAPPLVQRTAQALLQWLAQRSPTSSPRQE